jgi:hypothetical protein
MSATTPRLLFTTLVCLFIASPTLADDWHNAGGNAGRHGFNRNLGPTAPDLLWSGGESSLIAWQPVIEGTRAFMVRQLGWASQEPNASPVIAMDTHTGTELWRVDIPFEPGDWTTWVVGVHGGQVYACRGGNGATSAAPIYALDVATSSVRWTSEDEVDAGGYDGCVFAPNGDLVVGSFSDIWRIRASDGTTAWHATRTGSVSSTCGAVIHEDAVYIADATAGGHVIKRYDLATGIYQYQSDLMPGFTIQNQPMAGPDGTIYLSRTQNNAAVDFIYAFADTGFGFELKWSIPAAWSTTSEFGVGPDGSVYMLVPGPELARIDPKDGSIINTTGVLPGFSKPRIAIDALGRVYLGNGAFSSGRLYAYDAALTELWSVPVTNINIGGPALGPFGTLLVCGVGTDVRVYRSVCPGDCNCDGAITFDDIQHLVAALTGEEAWIQYQLTQTGTLPACPYENCDIDGVGGVTFLDIAPFVNLLGTSCP